MNDDGLVNRSLLKIQSAPLGNLRESAFDGDEMNVFCPQSIQTQIELEEIADVKKQIIYWSLPNVMILDLKRFTFCSNGQMKKNQMIFPVHPQSLQ